MLPTSVGLCLIPVLEGCGGKAVGVGGGAANAVVGETVSGHDLRIIQVAAVDHDGVLEFLAKAGKVEAGEFLPLGEDEQGVGVMGCCVGRLGESDAGRYLIADSLHGGGIVGGDFGAFLQ